MNTKILKVAKYVAIILAFLALFLALQRLIIPKYMSETFDGALTTEYYAEPKNHSIIFIGDCGVYQTFSPAELFREFGFTSYIRGGAAQTIWQSYWLLKDTLRYETPDIVILSAEVMEVGEPVSEPYNRLNIDGMRMSGSKIGAIKSSAIDGEYMLSYIFPILRFNERWHELSPDDFKYYFKPLNVGLNGYFMRSETVPVTVIPKGARLEDYSLPTVCFEYLDKIRELCAENNISFILIKSPSIWPYWYDEWDNQVSEYAERHSLPYYNLLKLNSETGIDYDTDTANGGNHINVHGAEKLSRWLGAELSANYNLIDHRNDLDVTAVWELKLEDYDRLKEIQLREFEENGKVLTHTYKKSERR